MKKKTAAVSLTKRDFISLADFSREEIGALLLLARKLKRAPFSTILARRSIGLIFQKPSTRTSVSFAVGVTQLGGHSLILNADVLQLKRGESPKDTARVLDRYLDAIVVRANRHQDVLEMASYADIPVINGLTELEHPCQVMADLLTILEARRLRHPRELRGFKISYFGDGNNMAHSWMLAAGLLGMQLRLACPPGYRPRPEFQEKAAALARSSGGEIEVVDDPLAAAKDADALYTDVWASMGQESESQRRRAALAPFQLNAHVLGRAKPNALVMHCLPAHRGEEITEDVMEGPHSVIFEQAENRLHAQKAVLAILLGGKKR